MKTHELTIEGMSCQHCIMHVKQELGRIAGLVVEDVQIGKARVQFDDADVPQNRLVAAVHDAGYKLISIR